MEQEMLEQQELREAQERLSAAKRKLELAEQMRLKRALAEYRAAEEKRIFEQQRERERIEKLHAERKAKEDEERLRLQRSKEAEERRLEAELAACQEAEQQRAKREAELRKIQEQAFLLEQEARRIESEAMRSKPLPQDETQTQSGLGRTLLFSHLSGLPAQQTPERAVSPQKAEVGVPEEYRVHNGRVDPRVFETRFGVQNASSFFVNPATGELVINGYRWRIEDSLSPRIWQHGCVVYIALVPGGYELRRVGTSDRIGVMPIAPVEGLTFEPLPEESAAIDQDELLMCEATQ